MEACASIASILEKEEVEQLVVPTLNSAAKVRSSLSLVLRAKKLPHPLFLCLNNDVYSHSCAFPLSQLWLLLQYAKVEGRGVRAWSSLICEESSC